MAQEWCHQNSANERTTVVTDILSVGDDGFRVIVRLDPLTFLRVAYKERKPCLKTTTGALSRTFSQIGLYSNPVESMVHPK